MPKECEFTVIDATKDDDYLKQARKDNPGAILAKSLKDMVDKLLDKVKKNECDCISRLRIIGHGGEGLIVIGAGKNGGDPEKRINEKQSEWEDQLKRLKPKLCKKAEIELLACFFGAGQKGADKLNALAKFLDVTVIGYTCYTLPGGYPKIKKKSQNKATPKKPAEKMPRLESSLPSFKSLRSPLSGYRRNPPEALFLSSGYVAPDRGVPPPPLLLRDPEFIQLLLGQINPRRFVDTRYAGGWIEARLGIGRRSGGIDWYEITDGFHHIGPAGRPERFHPILPFGRIWFKQLAALHRQATQPKQRGR